MELPCHSGEMRQLINSVSLVDRFTNNVVATLAFDVRQSELLKSAAMHALANRQGFSHREPMRKASWTKRLRRGMGGASTRDRRYWRGLGAVDVNWPARTSEKWLSMRSGEEKPRSLRLENAA